MLRTIVAGLAAVAAMPTAAQTVRTVISAPAATGDATVEISFLNTGTTAVRFEPPATLAADGATGGGVHRAVVLTRTGAPGATTLAAGGFVTRVYALPPARVADVRMLTLSGGSALALATTSRAAPTMDRPAPGPAPAETGFAGPPTAVASSDRGNAFLPNLSAYAPIYAVYGPATNTDARLQFSFKYQIFGAPGRRTSWLDGFDFAYTQRLFWDLGTRSSPFRNVDYNPELIYLAPSIVTRGAAFGGQAGVAHLSNGRDGTSSRSFNYVYVQPSATLPIGDWKLTLGPRLTAYVGDLTDNPDLVRYRGNTGLFAQIGKDDGWRLSTTSRINFATGKGAVDAEVTYPLNRLVPGLNLYAFGQGFTGYGENLLDYNRRQTRLRLGIGIVR